MHLTIIIQILQSKIFSEKSYNFKSFDFSRNWPSMIFASNSSHLANLVEIRYSRDRHPEFDGHLKTSAVLGFAKE